MPRSDAHRARVSGGLAAPRPQRRASSSTCLSSAMVSAPWPPSHRARAGARSRKPSSAALLCSRRSSCSRRRRRPTGRAPTRRRTPPTAAPAAALAMQLCAIFSGRARTIQISTAMGTTKTTTRRCRWRRRPARRAQAHARAGAAGSMPLRGGRRRAAACPRGRESFFLVRPAPTGQWPGDKRGAVAAVALDESVPDG